MVLFVLLKDITHFSLNIYFFLEFLDSLFGLFGMFVIVLLSFLTTTNLLNTQYINTIVILCKYRIIICVCVCLYTHTYYT